MYTSDCLLCILIVLSQFTNMLPSVLEEGDIDFQVRRTHLNTLKVKIVIFMTNLCRIMCNQCSFFINF